MDRNPHLAQFYFKIVRLLREAQSLQPFKWLDDNSEQNDENLYYNGKEIVLEIGQTFYVSFYRNSRRTVREAYTGVVVDIDTVNHTVKLLYNDMGIVSHY